MPQFRTPVATYRLQFNAQFRFEDATPIIPYLASLGVTDIYSSPILKATPGSTHGYDVVDAQKLNPEIGSDEEFDRFAATLRDRNMGLLVDIVPNHMAASHDNVWWMSVLENGPASRFIHYFDIEWTSFVGASPGDRKVLLPILGRPYGDVLEEGELQLGFDERGFFVTYFDRRFPITPLSYFAILRDVLDLLRTEGETRSLALVELKEMIENLERPSPLAATGDERLVNSQFLKQTLYRLYQQDEAFHRVLDETLRRFNGVKGDRRSYDKLDSLIEKQWYRLAYWRLATEEINYRRFFDIADLVGVRIEEPEVFEARHAKIFELIEHGDISGLRIDHIDGLFDPVSHLQKLQLRIRTSTATDSKPFYVVVEKILSAKEVLPKSFECSGTTGYDFLNRLNAVFVDPEGLTRLGLTYATFTDGPADFEPVAYRSKKKVLDLLFAGEIRRLGGRLARVAASDRNARDFAPSELAAALVEVTAALPVYRTYVRGYEVSDSDRGCIDRAITTAMKRGDGIDERIFRFLRRVLLVDPPHYAASHRGEWLEFVMRWQQFTGRVTAKGVEDTAFYNYNRLLSLNEVGGEPDGEVLRDPVTSFHRHNVHTVAEWPHDLNATATHDTKRGEDTRARINVISELAFDWHSRLLRWATLNRELKRNVGGVLAPDPNEEILVYQTLLGTWPLEDHEMSSFSDRLRRYFEKALREAKVHSSWSKPVPEYEHAVAEFAVALLDEKRDKFFSDFSKLQRKVAFFGFLNGLAQLVLKIAAPGVPDFYQGTELWDLTLVDPDNRRPVDFEMRRSLLQQISSGEPNVRFASGLLRRWKDGAVKLFVTHSGLELRRARASLFLEGAYQPLELRGGMAKHAIAFIRRRADEAVIAVVPRLLAQVMKTNSLPLGRETWESSAVIIPQELRGPWKNIFTGESTPSVGQELPLASIFQTFPVALLVHGA